jgi:hypothetical protein
MKLYIENYNPKKLLDKMSNLKEYLSEKKNVIFIYSEDGIFEISENNIYQLEPFSEKIQRITLDNHTYFLIDYTEIKRELSNYIPAQHNGIETTIEKYTLTKGKNNLQLIIYLSKQNEKWVPYDFFIEMDNNENLTNNFVKENLNVFLSLLN